MIQNIAKSSLKMSLYSSTYTLAILTNGKKYQWNIAFLPFKLKTSSVSFALDLQNEKITILLTIEFERTLGIDQDDWADRFLWTFDDNSKKYFEDLLPRGGDTSTLIKRSRSYKTYIKLKTMTEKSMSYSVTWLLRNTRLWRTWLPNLVVKEHSVITKRFLSQIGRFSAQIKPGYNEQKWLVPSSSL